MDTQTTYPNWVDPVHKTQRSARITDAEWEKHKTLLVTLYKTYTLLDVQSYMKIRHGFNAS